MFYWSAKFAHGAEYYMDPVFIVGGQEGAGRGQRLYGGDSGAEYEQLGYWWWTRGAGHMVVDTSTLTAPNRHSIQ